MPVPQQPGTATTVVSTGTEKCARFGIEGQSVGASPTLSSSHGVTSWGTVLDLGRRDHYAGGSMPTTIASAVPTPIISFAIFAAHLRS